METKKKQEYLLRLHELESLYSSARTAALRLQIIEEVEEIQAVFLRNRLEVPTFEPEDD